MRPSLTQPLRSSVRAWSPNRIDSSVVQNSSYVSPNGALTQISAATVAARSSPAEPDSVAMNDRTGAATC